MFKKFTQKQIIIIAVLGVAALGLVYLFSIGGIVQRQSQQKVTLTVWGTESPAIFNNLLSSYSTYRKNVTISYTFIDPAEYDSKILSALAAGNGPDVFEIGNRDLPRWKSTLAYMPTSTFAAQFDVAKLQSYFPSVVQNDFSVDDQIYALPLSIDTLAMIYNRDFFDSAGIATPPKTWTDFQNDIPKLRVLNGQGQITRAAVALGGSEKSIVNAPDILSLLMLQNGTVMMASDFSSAQFANGNRFSSTGLSAFNFYLEFANASSPYYTWNDAMGDATQSFIQGKTAVIFDYQSAIANIKAKAPFLNIGVAAMPQPKDATIAVNYPKYQGLAVSKQGEVATAWDFVLYLTTYADGENMYIRDTGKPPAQRIAIAAEEGNPNLSIFASQALSARSWHEPDSQRVDAIFNSMIQNTLSGSVSAEESLNIAQSAVNALMVR